MLSFNQYVRAQSLEEAYALCQKKSNVVLGGMLWLKMQNGNKGTAIDLCDLGLDQIEETPEEYRIGAMVSLRTLETHAGLNELTRGAMAESVKHIVGVQFRNVATVGGSIYGRFGFSDVLTLFMALDAKVELYHECERVFRFPEKDQRHSCSGDCSENGEKDSIPVHEKHINRFSGTHLCHLWSEGSL